MTHPDLPFRDTSPERLARVRAHLREHGYTGRGICDRLGIPSLFDFKSLRGGRAGSAEVRDGLDALVRLFLDGEPVLRTGLEELLGEEAPAELRAVGLLEPHPDDGDAWAATALLYPVAGLYLVSDVSATSPGVTSPTDPLRDDAVYPPLTGSARDFIRDLPLGPCRRLLDLCAGTGIAALIGAESAERAWALDITDRSTRFAEFNAALNGITNVTALQGDLYDPVRGERFDRIVAHPPYVPSSGNDPVFRDGGEDGEQVLRRIVEGLPDHLEPGGLFLARCMATDRADAPLEARVREWLGSDESEFDVFVVVARVMDPVEQTLLQFLHGRLAGDAAQRQLRLFRSLAVERFVHGSIMIQRRASDRPVVTVRKKRGTGAGPRDLAWLREFEVEAARPGFLDHLAGCRPRLRDGTQVEIGYRVVDGDLEEESYRVTSVEPFAVGFALPREAGFFLPRFDGTRTVAEVHDECLRYGWIPEGTPAREFAGLVRSLIGGCVLELE